MRSIVAGTILSVFACCGLAGARPPLKPGSAQPAAQTSAPTGDLSRASADDLFKVYDQLSSLAGSDQYAVTENATFKRDAGTFTFQDGRLAFSKPVAGHVVAAVFTGEGVFELDPPTDMDRRQISRFSREPRLRDGFREAVFFFTDDSWPELSRQFKIVTGGDAEASGKALQNAQSRLRNQLNGWWGNQAKGAFPTRNLAARMAADLSDPTSKGFFLADIRSEHHDQLFYQVSWNRDGLLVPGFANDEEVALVHWKPGEYFEWWSGFHLAAEYAQNPHPEHRTLLAHASDETIDADVTDNHISATAEIKFQVPEARVRVLPMSLDGVLRISSVTDGAGSKLRFIQEPRESTSDPWVILPESSTPGKFYTIKITYDEDSTRDSRVIQQQGSGLYYVGSRESWYPSFGAFDDRTHFVLRFRSPRKFAFVATGHPVSSEKDGKALETQWESEIPYNVVGFNYGDFVSKSRSSDNLTISAYIGRQLPDVLASLKAAMDMSDLAQGVGGSHSSEARTGILTGGLNTAPYAQTGANISFAAFRLYENYFGGLPFKTISVTEQPVFGFGQSWPTLIFLPWDSLLDSTTRNSLGLQSSGEGREFYDVVAVHELSHQWWGHMVGWKTYHDQWLSEGFAHFSAALFIEATDPKRFRAFWDMRRWHLLQKDKAGHRPEDVAPLFLNLQADAYLEPEVRNDLIYDKGAYVLEMLRELMEDSRAKDPDARFIDTMHDFVSTYAGKNASTEDFHRIVARHMNDPMDWFFNEWVYGTEIPTYQFSYDLKDAGGGRTVLHLDLTQSGVSDSFFMKVPVYVWVQGSPHRLGLLGVKGSTTATADVPLPVRPDKVTLDEYHTILAEEKP
ncbi:MAG TPA: M1 family aminopeptidase [Terriglobia bacterium]|nr:M1 family aminopeptidase [Terriglobia bacterium]